MSRELAPECPRCQSEKTYVGPYRLEPGGRRVWAVTCESCHMKTWPQRSRRDALETWADTGLNMDLFQTNEGTA